ncbi:MAG: 4-diphosphocytidyl-2C-methyl-D-erythritol kinase [Firmicutes bacterium]|nr:4-diphosphocytidyl-2C-methyl-D-erythritol kinase [Alicyclobacillaceae bacterium]MCL6497220.1 4-diphosphocytidyl-2C-methyl-D-erythritol kinase [Bacillota bacterium]
MLGRTGKSYDGGDDAEPSAGLKGGESTDAPGRRLTAWAKINLGLWVGPRQADGYHLVDTVLAEVSLADVIEVEPGPTWTVVTDGPFALDLVDPAQHSVTRAQVALTAEDPTWPSGWHVRVRKQIPPAAGLGGGSMDAAAWLRFAAELRPQLAPALPVLARGIGADVAFGLVGGIARGQGRGDRLTLLRAAGVRGRGVVLANPGWPMATAAVYAALDQVAAEGAGPSVAALVRALEAGEWDLPWDNGLERAAWAVQPRLREFKAWLDAQGASGRWWLSGSGATYYALVEDVEEARALLLRLQKARVPWAAAGEVAPRAHPGP